MPCYKPLAAYKLLNIFTESGKNRIVVLGKKDKDTYESKEEAQYVELACGQCIGCRIARSKDWALRCVHEASLYEYNCFITLTYCDGIGPKHLDCNHDIFINPTGTLVKSHFQKFMKRFRKHYQGKDLVINEAGAKTYPIRYFMAGEYGSKLERPHYHACVFNFDFDDKTLWSVRNGTRLYRSPALERLWPYGFSTIGSVTAESAAYVARYVTKKINGENSYAHYQRENSDTGILEPIEPEYIAMSRRPGISRRWFEKYKEDIYTKDFLTDQGKKFQTPRYYDRIYDTIAPVALEAIKAKRKEKANGDLTHKTLERLHVREKVCQANFKIKERTFEND